MGYKMTETAVNTVFDHLKKDYILYAPVRMEGGNPFSDTDCIRYGSVSRVEEIVFDRKSDYSFKEILLPLSETLFFFTEEQVKEADKPEKGAIVFLRSCDLHAVRRLDEMYLKNGAEDYYYKRLRERVRFALMGCTESFDNCFCASMGTNRCDDWDLALEPCPEGGGYYGDCGVSEWAALMEAQGGEQTDYKVSAVEENPVKVSVPENLTAEAAGAAMWDEYDSRCINCGRCNFVCPTCTCFTMQDIFYTDNGRVGERRRVQASCMADGFTDVAGGGSCRKKNGERMRFKTLHKVLDYKQRFGYHMCVGCGRCGDICPEYISFSGCVNKLSDAMKEVGCHDAE